MTATSPTLGHPAGEHRVLEPPGAAPLAATRLDALSELWDGEVRLELEAMVLRPAAHRAWVTTLRPDPAVLRAAMVEALTERGGVGPEAADASMVGTVATVGSAHPHAVAVGDRVVVTVPAGAIPVFAVPTDAWDGGRVVPLAGHAILPANAVTIPIDDAPAPLAALVADLSDLPAVLAGGTRTVVVGLDAPAGPVAVATAVAQHRDVTVVVGSLAAARLARALGADTVAITAVDEPVAAADQIRTVVGDRWQRGRADLAVVTDPAGAALAPLLAPAVQVLTPGTAVGRTVDAVLRHAAAAGGGVAVHAGRGPVTDRGAALRHLVASDEVLGAAMRWQAGIGPQPRPDPEERV